jgi:hypothetical protein
VTVAVISASVDWKPIEAPMPQAGVEMAFYPFTNENLPPRPCALHPRMVAKVPKVFGWQMVPQADAYVWLDASLTFRHEGVVAWFVEQLQEDDAALFTHPFRQTARQEADYLEQRMMRSHRLMVRYRYEWIDAQMRAIEGEPDDRLFAAGAFVYRSTTRWQTAMHAWWEHMTRYCINDQLSLPYVLATNAVPVRTISLNIFDNPHLRAASC